MKKILKIKIVCFLIGLLPVISSCRNQIDSNLAELNKMQNEYIKDCEHNKYDEARSIVGRMESLSKETSAAIKGEVARLRQKGLETGKYTKFEETREKYKNVIIPINEHMKYVNNKEIYFLLGQPSRENDNRIIFLYNTYEYNELPNMEDVLEVAISMGDDYLAERLIKSGVRISHKAYKAASRFEMNDLIELMDKIKEDRGY